MGLGSRAPDRVRHPLATGRRSIAVRRGLTSRPVACRNELGRYHLNFAVTPLLDEIGRRARIGDDRVDPLGRHEGKERRAPPLRVVEGPDDALARIAHLPLDPNLFGIQVHETAIETDAARAEEALADAG